MKKGMDFLNDPAPVGPPQIGSRPLAPLHGHGGHLTEELPSEVAHGYGSSLASEFGPARDRQASNTKRFLIGLGLLVVIVGFAGFALFTATKGPIDAANKFLAAEAIGDIDALLELASAYPECWGSDVEDRLQSVITKIDFDSYDLRSTFVSKTPSGTTGRVGGIVDIGYVTNIEFLMISESGTWKVCGFHIE